MFELPRADYLCDTSYGDGKIFFYDDRMEWRLRGAEFAKPTFVIRYDEIQDIEVIPTRKKTVIIKLKDGTSRSLFLYKVEELYGIINERMEALKLKDDKKDVVDATVTPVAEEEDKLAKLERLAKLHKDGALTDEEFAAAKKALLGL